MATSNAPPPHRDTWLTDGQLAGDLNKGIPRTLAPGRSDQLISTVKTTAWSAVGTSAMAHSLFPELDLTKAVGYGTAAALALTYVIPRNAISHQILGGTGISFGLGYWGARALKYGPEKQFMSGVLFAALAAAGVLSAQGLLFNLGTTVTESLKLPNYDATNDVKA